MSLVYFISGGISLIFINGLLLGASGGIAAIGGALLTQWKEVKDSKTLFVALACVGVIYVLSNLDSSDHAKVAVDHIGHMAGFAFGLTYQNQRKIYSRFFGEQYSQTRSSKTQPDSVIERDVS